MTVKILGTRRLEKESKKQKEKMANTEIPNVKSENIQLEKDGEQINKAFLPPYLDNDMTIINQINRIINFVTSIHSSRFLLTSTSVHNAVGAFDTRTVDTTHNRDIISIK